MRARTLEEAMHLALEDADRLWRRQLPEIAKKVDAIKAQSGWKKNTVTAVPMSNGYRLARCAHCDAQFVSEKRGQGWSECCSRTCANRRRHQIAS